MCIRDRPCTGLDIYNRSYLFDTINKLAEKKTLTIVYVTHYVEEIIPLFDHILYLKNGNVFAQGRVGDMLKEEMLENLLDYPVDLFAEPDGTYRLAVESHSTLANMF